MQISPINSQTTLHSSQSYIPIANDHYFFSVAEKIALICQPLFQQYQLSTFVFARYFNNGSAYMLTNNNNWLAHHLRRGYMLPAPPAVELLSKNEAYNFVSSDGPFKQAKLDLLYYFNSDQAIDLIYKRDNYYDVVCYAFLPKVSQAINIFLNNMAVFKQFAHYFQTKALGLINEAEHNKIILPKSMQGINAEEVTTKDAITNANNFANFISPPSIIVNNKAISFTKREMDCITYLLRGYSMKETAVVLKLSPRTVETHLNNLKNKFDCSKTSELIAKIFKSGISSQFIQ